MCDKCVVEGVAGKSPKRCKRYEKEREYGEKEDESSGANNQGVERETRIRWKRWPRVNRAQNTCHFCRERKQNQLILIGNGFVACNFALLDLRIYCAININ